MKSFSELTSASQVDNADLVAISQSTGNGYASKKATVGDVTKNVYASNGKLGAKNLLPLTLDYIKQINTNGTWNNNVLTYRGITYTVNADAQGIITSIDVNGTATNDSRILFDEQVSGLKYSGNLLNGKTISNDGGLYVQGASSPYTTYARINDTGSIQIGDCSQVNVRVFYYVANGKTISNETIYPMIRLASDTDAIFQPYAMTNLELTKAVESGGGTGGHTIIDENGNSMTARAGLQFFGAVEVTDDSANDRTLVEVLGGDFYNPVIYSLEEREIGVCEDGRPLYEKTIDFGAVPDTATKNVAHNIANVDKIWVYDGYVYGNSGQTFQLNRPTNAFAYQWETTADRTNVSIQDFANFSNDFSAFVVVRYTKTTDVAGSGSWTPQGVPTHRYSTDEQIVGTWIDGSTLYEKTYEITHTFTNGSNDIELQSNCDFTSNNLKKFTFEIASNGISNVVSKLTDNTLYVNSSNKLLLYFECSGGLSGARTVRVTVKYTKSS